MQNKKALKTKASASKSKTTLKYDEGGDADKAIEKVLAIGEAMTKKIDEDEEKEAKAPKAVPIGQKLK